MGIYIYYFGNYIAEGKSILNGLGRDSVNMILLFLGILLHGNLKNYLDALKDSVSLLLELFYNILSMQGLWQL